jgi:hypothetical protein
MKTYGIIVADNGSDWFLSGEPSESWNNDDLQRLGEIKGAAFEAVDVSSLMVDPDSGQAAAIQERSGALTWLYLLLRKNQEIRKTNSQNCRLHSIVTFAQPSVKKTSKLS